MNTLTRYYLGFGLSIILTLAAFWLAGAEYARESIIAGLVFLAVAQLAVQLVCFLHIAEEKRPRWNGVALAFAAFVVVVLVGGTLWIMTHLMHPDLSEIYPTGEITPQAQGD